jgi:putative ABC transport system permease protein
MRTSNTRRPAMALARTLIALGSWLVPADVRAEWIRDWQAEVAAIADRGRSPVRFAWGAPRHALALRRDGWSLTVVSSDVRFAWRFLRRQPALVTAAGVTIAVGIGATLAMFGVVDSILLTPLPYRDPGRLVELWERNPLFNWTEAEIAPANLLDWRDRNVVFADVASYMGGADRLGSSVRLTLGGQDPRPFDVLQVSANFFELLGAAPMVGRTFAPGEDIPDRHREIVLADRFWRTAFGGRRDVVNGRVSINGRDWTVIGVMPASFTFAEQPVDAWIPLAMDVTQARTMRQAHLLRAIARLKPGVTVAQAQDNLSAIARDLEREYPKTNRQMAVGVGPLSEWWVGPSRQSLLLFLAAVALVLLIACANVANLLIVRTAERTHDLALRSALGASRGRLLRQLLLEALTLASVGTVAGLVLALILLRLFVAFAPASLPRVDEVGLNGVVVLVAVALTGLIAVLVGLAPAAIASRVDLRDAIASTGRSVLARGRLPRAIVAAEVALAVVPLVSAAAALLSFRALVRVDPGFPVEGLLTARVSLPAARYGGDGQASAFYETLVARLKASPDVQAAGATMGLPLDFREWTGDLFIETQPSLHARELQHRSITSGYLEALGVRLIAGRTIQTSDRAGQPLVVVANDTLVRRYFGGQEAVGQRIAFDPPSPTTRWRTIVGVVSDEPQRGLGAPIAPAVYDAEGQEEMSDLAVAVRSRAPAAWTAALVRSTIRGIDPQLAAAEVEPLSDRFHRVLAPERVAAWLAGAFGLVAMCLAALGIYGVVAYAVTIRTREVGVRVACGATATRVVSLMLAEHMRMVVAGLAVGLAVAAGILRLASPSLHGASATGVTPIVLGTVTLLVSALAACVWPARRATRIDPAVVLRDP